MMTYDSTQDTLDHIDKVRAAIFKFNIEMGLRADRHDVSKLREPERSLFDKYTPLLRETTYGSEEYKQYLQEMGAALTHHYQVNSHHPEFYPVQEGEPIQQLKWDMNFVENNPCFSDEAREAILEHLTARLKEMESRVNGMTLMDLVEMFCDWQAVWKRDGIVDPTERLEISKVKFGISEQLYSILMNTAREMFQETS